MSKLSNRQILQLHAMHADGATNAEIARVLSLNRNSVTAHIHGEIAYPAQVYATIALSAPLIPHEWLTLRQAAAWIPGHPSPSKMRVLVSGKSWRGRPIPKLRTKLRAGRRVTRVRWIKTFVADIYPEGIWITEGTLMCLIPYNTIRTITLDRLGWTQDQAKRLPFGMQLCACPALAAAQAVESSGHAFDIPAELVHRATTIEKHIGTAVI